jgi:hypothetical protein
MRRKYVLESRPTDSYLPAGRRLSSAHGARLSVTTIAEALLRASNLPSVHAN